MLRALDIMRQPVITMSPTTPVTEAARVLNDNGISGCPVVDHTGKIIGILSRTNLLDFALTVEGGALTPMLRILVPGGEEAEEEEAWAPLGEDFEVPEVQDLMTGDVITVDAETAIADVALTMSEERIHRVPVVRGDRLVGIITSLDLLAVFGGARKVRETASS